MKKLIGAFIGLSLALGGLMGYTVAKVTDAVEENRVEVSKVEEPEYFTEYVMVYSVTEDGKYLDATPIQEDTQLEYGYILDMKYQLGDIVEITYNDDELIAERLVSDDELKDVYNLYGDKIDYLMDEGVAMDYIMTEDGTWVHKSFYAMEDK